jgi:hypothetical protein
MARRKIEKVSAPPPMPSEPPITAEERKARNQEWDRLIGALRQRNLNTAVLVAQAVAAGRIPELEDHFGELGRRFAPMLDRPEQAAIRRAAFKVIDGRRP